jgi:hypothetical protein
LAAVLCCSAARAQTFHGYFCTEDCSGHEAGYEWAEDNAIVDPSDCGGNSNSFIEGCEVWAEEQQDEMPESSSSMDDTDDNPYQLDDPDE